MLSLLSLIDLGFLSANSSQPQVLLQLRRIIDPDLYRDIVSLGFVRDLTIDYDRSSVAFTLELTTPACPVKDMFLEEAERLLKDLGWIDHVDINLTSRKSGVSVINWDLL